MTSQEQRTFELIPLTVPTKCSLCRHAVSQSSTTYCAKLRKNVENVRNCPDFELEPPEYRLYKRT